MDIQVLLIFILAIITIVLVGVGIYLILVLKEFRQTVQRANLILGDVENVTNVVAHPMSIVTSLLQGYKAIKNLRKEE